MKTVNQEQYKRIEAALKSAPKVEGPMTIAQAVQKLLPSIKTMRTKGHDWQQIADVLRMEGVAVSGATLRRYCAPKRSAAAKNHA